LQNSVVPNTDETDKDNFLPPIAPEAAIFFAVKFLCTATSPPEKPIKLALKFKQ
jgi:hypothetical protein